MRRCARRLGCEGRGRAGALTSGAQYTWPLQPAVQWGMWTLNALGALMLVVGLGAGCLVDQGLYEQRKADLTEAGPDGGSDLDGDGFGDDDCDDSDPSVYPGAVEVPYDETDQDCDGSDLDDVDGDGFDAEIVGGTDCDDLDPAVHPDANEAWTDALRDLSLIHI